MRGQRADDPVSIGQTRADASLVAQDPHDLLVDLLEAGGYRLGQANNRDQKTKRQGK
jgi:hypothetical protein